MVTIVNYKKLMSSAGKEFYTLILQGGIEMIRSAETGNFYATVKQCSITSTLDEENCKAVIGEKLPGRIEKVQCDPFEYTIKETGEVIELSHRWKYVEEKENTSKSKEMDMSQFAFSTVEEMLA